MLSSTTSAILILMIVVESIIIVGMCHLILRIDTSIVYLSCGCYGL